MKAFRVRWERRGDHIQCRVFVADRADLTFAPLGTLVMRVDDFDALRCSVASNWSFLHERDAVEA